MLTHYLATYRDILGEEATIIYNDGRMLQMVVRGMTFRGSDFETFSPITLPHSTLLPSFPVWHPTLCACVITCVIPLLITHTRQLTSGLLRVHVDLGTPQQQSLSHFILQLTLTFAGETITSHGRSNTDTFDEQLTDLMKALPPTTMPMCCHTCAFSDYAPTGSGTFGDMRCYRGHKEAYRNVTTKQALWRIPITERVQETYLCPEYELRLPGTGYRG